jgi:hypothetical protein
MATKSGKKDPQAEGEKRLIRMGAEEVVAAEHAAEGKLGKGKAEKKS